MLDKLAQEPQVEFFSGNAVFSEESREDVLSRHWLLYDGHWSETGAGLFAERLAEYIAVQ